jgi:hypothetical protein
MIVLTTTTEPMTIPIMPDALLAGPPLAEIDELVRDMDPIDRVKEELNRSG